MNMSKQRSMIHEMSRELELLKETQAKMAYYAESSMLPDDSTIKQRMDKVLAELSDSIQSLDNAMDNLDIMTQHI